MRIVETTEQIEALHDNLSRSSFHDVNLDFSTFSNSSFTGTSYESVCFNNSKLHNATCIGMHISYADLSHVAISQCNVATMTIDGVPVADLLACYKQHGPKAG